MQHTYFNQTNSILSTKLSKDPRYLNTIVLSTTELVPKNQFRIRRIRSSQESGILISNWILEKVHFTLTRASGYRIVDLFPPRFYDNVQIRRPGVGVVDIVKPSDVDRDDSDQEDVHVTQARIVLVTALSMRRD